MQGTTAALSGPVNGIDGQRLRIHTLENTRLKKVSPPRRKMAIRHAELGHLFLWLVWVGVLHVARICFPPGCTLRHSISILERNEWR